MSTHDSLILLGFSGVGKDTLAKSLITKYSSFVNVKFSALTKDILAQAFRVPRVWLDGFDSEPKWRNLPLSVNGKSTGVTPITLLNALFYGAPETDLHRLNIEYALSQVPESSIPVFTDIRRQAEMDAVKQKFNPYVVYLSSTTIKPGKADGEIAELSKKADCMLMNSNYHITPDEMLGFLETHLRADTSLLKPRKPTIHLYVNCEPLKAYSINHKQRGLPNYEPFQLMLSQVTDKVAEVFSLPQSVAYARAIHIFQTLANETATEDLQLTPITEDCWMKFDKSHVSLLPKLRKMANIQLHNNTRASSLNHLCFTIQEIANAKSV